MNDKRQKGFTLLEIVIAVGIFVGVASIFGKFAADIFFQNKILSAQLKAQNELRSILGPFPSEVRSAAPSDKGDYPIVLAEADQFVFYTDVDKNGSRERVRYFIEDETFKKGILYSEGDPEEYNPSNEIIIQVVQNILPNLSGFTYYDETYDGETITNALVQPVSPHLVRLVSVTVTADEDTSKNPPAVSASTKVSIRNLKNNL